MNFAESSNVVLKKTAIFLLFFAACYETDFWHPKFLLMDNIEDKGMEQELSHKVIFTTSMMDPSLKNNELTIGPKFKRQNKAWKVFERSARLVGTKQLFVYVHRHSRDNWPAVPRAIAWSTSVVQDGVDGPSSAAKSAFRSIG